VLKRINEAKAGGKPRRLQGKASAGDTEDAGSAKDVLAPAALPLKTPAPPRTDLTPVVGKNLKRFRFDRGLSLEALSRVAGVSRAMLGQIELGQSTPTINVVWKIARALDVPFSALISDDEKGGTMVLSRAKARVLRSQDGSFSSRALFPQDRARSVEFYELRLAPRAIERADAHRHGTVENLIVAEGMVALDVDGVKHLLDTGDAIFFEADVAHAYENTSLTQEAVMFLVMTYAKLGSRENRAP
jgi:transcriptional regulator with XRE-family HTH domain